MEWARPFLNCVPGVRADGLTWEQQQQAQALLERANRERGRLRGAQYEGRIAGIRTAVLSGAVGNSALGRWLLPTAGAAS